MVESGSGARRRSGFSLVEALVVLAVSGMALAVIFSIGTRAGDTGFALGRRALAAADQDLAVADLRTLLESPLLPPVALLARDDRRVIRGDARTLSFEALPSRPTPCAPRGWRGAMRLSIVESQGRSTVTCQAGAGPAVEIAAFDGAGLAFDYSFDGTAWRSDIDTGLAQDEVPGTYDLAPREVYIRLHSPGETLVLSNPASGLAETWLRPDDLL